MGSNIRTRRSASVKAGHSRVLRWQFVIVGLVTVLAGCGASATSAPGEVSDEVATPTTAEVPEELALADVNLAIDGDTGAAVRAGESVQIDHLLYNDAPTSRSISLVVQNTDLDVELSASSLRVGADEVVTITTTVDVPESGVVDDVFIYELMAVDPKDLDQRSVTEVRLIITEPVGDRPTVGRASGVIDTSEKAIVYVLNSASDADEDLDFTSLRVVAGGFKSADMIADPNGTITYFPFLNVEGEDKVLYEICDKEQRCDTGVLTVTVGG